MDESTSDSLIIVCAGGHAREVASYVRSLQGAGRSAFVYGFVDDHRFDETFEGAPVLGCVEQLGDFLEAQSDRQFSYITAIGNNRARVELVQRVEGLNASNLMPWTLRHASATIGEQVAIGAGTCIAPGVVITTQVTLGSHCIVNVNSSISHDVTLGSFVNVNPGATICGTATVGDGAYIGAGATVINNVQIGEWSVIGAGAVVIDDVPPHVTVVGVPARIVQRHPRGMRQSSLAG